MAGVGEAIEIDEFADARIVNDMMDEVGADEARAAGDKQIHKLTRNWHE